jgi:hypothetical protein
LTSSDSFHPGPSQAFAASANGDWPHTYRGANLGARCAPVAQPGPPASLVAANDALEAARVPVLRIWRATVSQWDVHLADRTPFVRAGRLSKVDCTHFCEPSGVLEAWVDETLCLGPPPP